ncbi:hypothetical protein M0802_014623 [Mischocyttarus mexicanus]|nr:hypothetical protein M0802_014625 [Mischocyttarus mexicanus]KAI4477985.1 hypothetical protein M0802_014623 [Mischocyttarus mexicanus]
MILLSVGLVPENQRRKEALFFVCSVDAYQQPWKFRKETKGMEKYSTFFPVSSSNSSSSSTTTTITS